MILKDGIVLYHGSSEKIIRPDLEKCKDGKDFGKGFYLTTDKSQAESFARTTVRRKIIRKEISCEAKTGYVSSFVFHDSKNLGIFEFEKADVNWLHCVCAHRMRSLFSGVVSEYMQYDVIAGKIANDRTNPTLTLYIGGAFGSPGSAEADDMAVRLLLPEVLTNQLCFRTENGIDCLEWICSEEIPYEK